MFGNARRITVTDLALAERCAVLRVAGELDLDTEKDLLDHAGRLVGNGHQHLVLDLTALMFCDSRGLNCLLSLNWLCGRMEGRLLLAGVGVRVMHLLTTTGACHAFSCFTTVRHALDTVPPAYRPSWPPGTG
ncbi:STAS domain-containing protein [Streptomyces sp. NPDC057445]|uniref:STAS domain-containing protein n=1 Tax=Streptomyces sp. NPDC057445 TaxID=3346136 RepID=UPI0036843262